MTGSADGSPREVERFEVIVVSYHSRHQIEGLLAGLPADVPVAIVDNARDADGLSALAAARPHTRYVDSGGGAGYSRAMNMGIRSSAADVVVTVNPDTRPAIETLEAIVADVVADETCISSSPLNVGGDGAPQRAIGGWEPTLRRTLVDALGLQNVFRRAGVYASPSRGESIDLDWVTGSCMAIARDRLLALGGLDERYFVYNEDMALGHAAKKAGMHQRLRTDLTVEHVEGGSGAPSAEMTRLNGASHRRYLLHHNGRVKALAMAVVYTGGLVLRAAVSFLLGRRDAARLYWIRVKGAWTGRAWVAGREVTARS